LVVRRRGAQYILLSASRLAGDRRHVHSANPTAVIVFSFGGDEQGCLCKDVDDFAGGGLLKAFGFAPLKRVARAVNNR
jgi:hypothetical protein